MKQITFTLLAATVAIHSISAEPEKLTTLRSGFEAASERALTPIRRTYVAELEKMKMEFTKSGKLEDALAVDAEIKLLGIHDTSSEKTRPAQSTSLTQEQKKALEEHLMTNAWIYGAPGQAQGQDAKFQRGGELILAETKTPWNWEIARNGLLEIRPGTGAGVTIEITNTSNEILLPKFSPNGEDRAFTLRK